MDWLMPVIVAPLRDTSYDNDKCLVVVHRDQKNKVYATASDVETYWAKPIVYGIAAKEDYRWHVATYAARRAIGLDSPREGLWTATSFASTYRASAYEHLARAFAHRGNSPRTSLSLTLEQYRRIQIGIPRDSRGCTLWLQSFFDFFE